MASARPLVAACVAAVIGAGAAGAAYGQSGAPADHARVQVEAVDVEQVERLAPGVSLNFSVYGSPGAAAMLRIDGARAIVDLRETQPGIYEGAYVIAPRDRIRADSRVVATLQRGPAIAHASLEEGLQLGQAPVPPLDAALASPAPVEPPVIGSPSANEHVVRGRPVPDAAFERGAGTPAVASPGDARSSCDSCGIVEAIRVVPGVPGPGNLGAVSGAVIGAVLGERAREAHMRRIARIHGGITGALTGRRADGDGGPRHEVRFRLPDGRTQVRSYPEPPAFEIGDRVSLDAPAASAMPTRP